MSVSNGNKFFDKFHIADLIVLIVIAIILTAVFTAQSDAKESTISSEPIATVQIPVEFTVRALNMDPFRQSLIEPSEVIGDTLLGTDAVITDCYFEEIITSSTNTQEGTLVEITTEDNVDIVFVIESTGVKDASAYKIGTQELRAGSGFFLRTDDFEYATTVESVNTDN